MVSQNRIFKGIFDKQQIFFLTNWVADIELQIPSIYTANKRKNSLNYFGATIWNVLPIELREINTLAVFKKEVRKEWNLYKI